MDLLDLSIELHLAEIRNLLSIDLEPLDEKGFLALLEWAEVDPASGKFISQKVLQALHSKSVNFVRVTPAPEKKNRFKSSGGLKNESPEPGGAHSRSSAPLAQSRRSKPSGTA